MNDEVKTILDSIVVSGTPVPAALFHFDGESDTFTVYTPSSESVALSGDNLPISTVVSFDIDIYSKSNYLALSDIVIDKFMSAGWVWLGNGNDTYDKDSGYYHRLIEFGKGRGVSYGK